MRRARGDDVVTAIADERRWSLPRQGWAWRVGEGRAHALRVGVVVAQLNDGQHAVRPVEVEIGAPVGVLRDAEVPAVHAVRPNATPSQRPRPRQAFRRESRRALPAVFKEVDPEDEAPRTVVVHEGTAVKQPAWMQNGRLVPFVCRDDHALALPAREIARRVEDDAVMPDAVLPCRPVPVDGAPPVDAVVDENRTALRADRAPVRVVPFLTRADHPFGHRP